MSNCRQYAVHIYNDKGDHLLRECRAVDVLEHAQTFAKKLSKQRNTAIVTDQWDNESTIYNVFINGRDLNYSITISRAIEKTEMIEIES